MKKRTGILITVLMLALLLATISVAAAKPGSRGAIKCDLDITFDGNSWDGRIEGEGCTLPGRIQFFAVRDEYDCPPGNTMHFVETFIINPDDGGSIEGKNWGDWDMKSGKFTAHGWVTASDGYPELVGNQYHEYGVTDSTNPSNPPINAEDGKMKLVPANRSLDSIPARVPQHPCFP